jgi:hypothetical protein
MFSVPMRSENTFYGLFSAEKMFSCRRQENIVFSDAHWLTGTENTWFTAGGAKLLLLFFLLK